MINIDGYSLTGPSGTFTTGGWQSIHEAWVADALAVTNSSTGLGDGAAYFQEVGTAGSAVLGELNPLAHGVWPATRRWPIGLPFASALGMTKFYYTVPGAGGGVWEAPIVFPVLEISSHYGTANHMCARLSNGAVKCWGGVQPSPTPTELGSSLPAIDLGTGRSAKAIAAGNQEACAILDNDRVKCWGWGPVLGLGDTVDRGQSDATKMGNNLPHVDLGFIAAGCPGNPNPRNGDGNGDGTVNGADYTMWADNQGKVYSYCGGPGDFNGDGLVDGADYTVWADTFLQSVPLPPPRTAKALASGDARMCAILNNDQVACWGYLIGVGSLNVSVGDGAGEMGYQLPVINLGTGRSAKAITAAGNHSCALLDNNQIKCWGPNNYGQLGLGDTVDRFFNDPPKMGNNLPQVNLGSIQAGCPGNANPLNGDGNGDGTVTGADYTLWADNQGKVYSYCGGPGDFNGDGVVSGADYTVWADTVQGTYPVVPRTAKAVTSSKEHTCALLDNNQVKCWGRNLNGQLGLGDTAHRGDNANEMGNLLPVVALGTGRSAKAIHANYHQTCVVLDNNQVKCWGENLWGQLGLGDQVQRGDNPGEMGDLLPAIALGTGRSATALTGGSNDGSFGSAGYTCALLDNQRVKCWGYAWTGMVGAGDNVDAGRHPGEMADALKYLRLYR